MIYLDYNATTPIDPRVADAMRPYLYDFYGNPSSRHAYGLRAREAVEKARGQVADLLSCQPQELIFTSGGTESNNLALKGVCAALSSTGGHLISSAVEHPAVSEICAWLATTGILSTRIDVDENGVVSAADLATAIRPETFLISIMHAQNEVGTIQPIPEIAKTAHASQVLLHCDAAQSVGKIETRVDALGVDLLSIAGHKFYGPKGVGALYVRDGVSLIRQMHGAGHERGLRPGTESVLLIVGLGAAAELAAEDLRRGEDHIRDLRDRLESRLLEHASPAVIHAAAAPRLPNTCSIAFPGLLAADIMAEMEDLACSAGSACHADGLSVSPVLHAMKVPVDVAVGTLRLSIGRFTTGAEIDEATEMLIDTVTSLRKSG